MDCNRELSSKDQLVPVLPCQRPPFSKDSVLPLALVSIAICIGGVASTTLLLVTPLPVVVLAACLSVDA